MNVEEIKAIFVAVLLIGTASISAYITHRVEDDRYEKLVLSYEMAKTQAVIAALEQQKEFDRETQKASEKEALNQQTIANDLRRKLNAVHNQVNGSCLSLGTIRLLDSEVLSRDPNSMPFGPGKLANSPSGLTADQLVASVLNNYGICKGIRQTLTNLQDFNKNVKPLETPQK